MFLNEVSDDENCYELQNRFSISMKIDVFSPAFSFGDIRGSITRIISNNLISIWINNHQIVIRS